MNPKFKRIYIQGNVNKARVGEIINHLYEVLPPLGFELFLDKELEACLPESVCGALSERKTGIPSDGVHVSLSLGGDGTVLRTAQTARMYNIPILPLNLGGLGFLTEISPDDLETRLVEVLNGQYYLDERFVLEVNVKSRGKRYSAVNDVVVDKAGFPRVIFLNTRIDGHFFNNYIADGLMVSSPTGSTGYSLSAGGPILMPNLEAMIISPICPHSLTNRPIVLSSSQIIEIEVHTDFKHAHLVIDGQMMEEMPSGTIIEIKKADVPVRLVRHTDSHFFQILRGKLRWGDDLRTKERWAQNLNTDE